ncbi:hypothetical protein nbrc107696_03730 [Gordonia spumicola]|uniref:Diacylglycerol O-acyltransferase n=1 Tax=Gordonia spumicola TaxID=589161 RepID=A0A7I9V3W4_9ACTN|nr:hypothetical protein nbrc107696_03730 [Gordonia spumicola]
MQRVTVHDAVYLVASREQFGILTAYAFDESAVGTETIVEWLADRARTLPTLQMRMVRPVAWLGDAFWSQCPDFDAADHVRVAHADTFDALLPALHEILHRPFALDRPLWSIHVFRGVRGVGPFDTPSTVVAVKAHHSMTDGRGLTEICRTLFSAARGAPARPELPLSRRTVTVRAVAELPLRPLLAAYDVARLLVAVRRMRREHGGVDHLPPVEFTDRPDDRRSSTRIGTVFVSMTRLRSYARTVGSVTTNDVVLAVIGDTVAAELGTAATRVVAAVPVAVAGLPDARNRVTQIGVDLATGDGLDVAERARRIHRGVIDGRERARTDEMAAVLASIPRMPPFVYGALARLTGALNTRRGSSATSRTVVSSVPKGPGDGWTLVDSPVRANFGCLLRQDPNATNHSVTSIRDVLAVNVAVDTTVVDLESYLDALRRGFDDLVPAVSEAARPATR